MSYDLGIDLGGTTVVAAVVRDGDRRPEPLALGVEGAALPATAHRGADGTVRTGEDAERAAAREPDGVVRDVTSRLGDEVPLVVGREPWRPDDVAAEIVLAAVRRAAAHEGGAARTLAVTHPAGWGPHRERTLRRALVRVGLGHAVLVAESRAAALAGARGPVAGVYDLGGRSFRAAVVRRTPAGRSEVLADSGTPDRAGGTDVDAAVLALVREQLGDDLDAALEGLPDDEARVGLAGLRDAAHAAKEQLSAETEARVDVALGALHTTVRLTRADLEVRITPLVAATVRSFASTVDAAGAPLDDVVLVGGSARIPLVARLLTEELERPVRPGADPATVVAQGAALAAAEHRARLEAAEVLTGPTPTVSAPAARPGRHRRPEPDAAEAAAEAVAAGAVAAGAVADRPAAAVATGAGAATDRRALAGARPGGSPSYDAAEGAAETTAAPGRTATALLERPRPDDDVPRPPVSSAEPPTGPDVEAGPLRRYRSWILAGITVLVLGAAAATVPIPGLTSARTAATPTPTTTPAAPSASPTPAPVASAAPAAPAAPTSTAPATGDSGGSESSGGSSGGSSDGSSSGSGSSTGSSAGRHSTATRPSATRKAPAAPATPTSPAAPLVSAPVESAASASSPAPSSAPPTTPGSAS